MKKVIILGASGVIGQHMRLCVPEGVEPVWVRSESDMMHVGMDLDKSDSDWPRFFLTQKPIAIVNLAGQGNVEEVSKDPGRYHYINVILPGNLARFCQRSNIHYVHVSSQAVFSGENPPYHADSPLSAINAYGRQKIEAEQQVKMVGSNWSIVRPSFVMGVKPIPHLGRKNPAEDMIENVNAVQVANRWFTACEATDVARTLWAVATHEPLMRAILCAGTPRTSRYDLATALGGERDPVRHEDFSGLGFAPRPRDTTYADGITIDPMRLMSRLLALHVDRQLIGPLTRARELSLFTGMQEWECLDGLKKGFFHFHHKVAEDFRQDNPQSMDDYLEWYRRTHAYVWELSAYHLDAEFNYSGMCNGIVAALSALGAKRVLCLGDGIGDMTLTLRRAGFDAVYHDLKGSKTAEFAKMRLWMHTGSEGETLMSSDWNPPFSALPPESFDAVCAADFMEHLPNVEDWMTWVTSMIRPGGLLFAQNAFNCGSGPDGSIPMHLTRNDRFEKDWDPLCESLGFQKLSTNWYKKPEVEPYASSTSV